jgi:7-cyano-7-deazaguanine synthase
MRDSAIVVFSGGQDSTICLHWALRTFKRVEAVFFDYGQRHANERVSAAAIAASLGVPLTVFQLDLFKTMGGNALLDSGMTIDPAPLAAPGVVAGAAAAAPESAPAALGPGATALPNTFVPGRNLVFLLHAASYGYTRGFRDLVTGVCQTDYSGYPDCRNETIRALEKAIALGLDLGNDFAIHTPLMFKTKAESVHWAAELGALPSLAFSHTCYEGAFPPCGKCPACVLRARGFAEAGVEDPLLVRAKGLGG